MHLPLFLLIQFLPFHQQHLEDPVKTQWYKQLQLSYRVHTGKIVQNLGTFQGLLIYFLTVFKDWKFKKNTDLYVKILLPEC